MAIQPQPDCQRIVKLWILLWSRHQIRSMVLTLIESAAVCYQPET
jgi:hypothetical protein